MPNKKLDDESVYEIKVLLLSGFSQKEIAARYEVSRSLISKLKTKIVHKDIVVLSKSYSDGYTAGYREGYRKGKEER